MVSVVNNVVDQTWEQDLRISICYLGSEFIDFASSEESR